MTKEQLKAMTVDTFTELRGVLDRKAADDRYDIAIKQINPEQHDVVVDTFKRPDKKINVKDENGTVSSRTVPVTRLSIPMQKLIVRRSVAFLTGNPIRLSADTEDESIEAKLLEVVQKTWDDNKLDYRSKEIARIMMTETECAELWYVEPAEEGYWNGTPNEGSKFRLRQRILAKSKGDLLYPIFDAYGDMIAFGREYDVTIDKKKITRFDLYTETVIYHYAKVEGSWGEYQVAGYDGVLRSQEINLTGKIPIIYYNQPQTEWHDVQTLIDRLETLMSNYSDMINYFGSPMLKIRGRAISLPDVGEQGKAVQLEGEETESDIDYLTWDAKPEAVIFEYDKIMEQIYTQTQTPDISFSSMAGVDNGSGIKLKLMFMDAVLKAMEHWENYGESIQRRINFIKESTATINNKFKQASHVYIHPIWTPFMPMNDLEEVEKIAKAVEWGFVSKKTAVAKNPMVDDAVEEMDNIEEEAKIVPPNQLDLVA